MTAFRNIGLGLLAAQLIAISPMSSVAWAAESKSLMTAGELTEIVRESNVGAKATNLQVVGTGPDVTVLAQKDSKSGERDLKIDAIFLARALVMKAPGQVTKVKVIFSQAEHPGRYVNISNKEINDYGSGKINTEQLLSSLRLIPVASDKAPDVVAGPQFERRLLIWQRIEKLREGGTGVEPFEAIFSEIDGMVKAGSGDPSKKLAYLEAKLGDQEEAIRQAKRTARGLGVPASKNSLSTAASPAAASAASGTSGGSGSPITYLPPDHEILRQIFHNRSDEMINLARPKNRDGAEKLIQLKKQINQSFQENKKLEAFTLMRQFQQIAKELTSTDMLAPPGAPSSGPGGPNGPEGGPGGGPPGGGPH